MKVWAEPAAAQCRSTSHLHKSPGPDPETDQI